MESLKMEPGKGQRQMEELDCMEKVVLFLNRVLTGILLCAVMGTIVGNGIIWVDAYETNDNQGMYAVFLIIISVCNFVAHSFNKPVMLDIAALMMTTVIATPACLAYQLRVQEKDTVFIGYLIALAGCALSFFAHFPTFGKQSITKRLSLTIPAILASGVVILGCVVLWSEGPKACETTNAFHVAAFWIAAYNIFTVLTAKCEGRDIVLFQASLYLRYSQPFETLCDSDKCHGAIALVWVGIVLIVLVCAYHAPREGVAFKKEELTGTPRGWAAMFFLCACVAGSVLVWFGKDNNAHPGGAASFTVMLMLLATILEVYGFASKDPTPAYIGMAIMASVISSGVTDIYPNRDVLMRSGYITVMMTSLMSIALPIKTGGAAPEKKLNQVGAFAGLALLVSCTMTWANGNHDVVSGYLGVLSIVSGAASYREGTLVCFYLSAVLVPRITPFTAPGNGWTPMLALLGVLALMYTYVKNPPEETRVDRSNSAVYQEASSYQLSVV